MRPPPPPPLPAPPARRPRRAAHRPRRSGRLIAGLAVLVVAGAVAALFLVGGYRRSDVLLSSGTAWLASPQGLITLVDGPSEQVIGNVQPTGATGPAPAVVQQGTSALVVDQQSGTVARIDGATYAITGPQRFGGGGPLQVLPAGPAAYVVDAQRGLALTISPTTLEQQNSTALGVSPGPDQAVVDRNRNLWAADARGGGLVRLDRFGGITRFAGSGDAAARLVTARGRPVLVDGAKGRAGWIDGSGTVPTWACTGLRLGAAPELLPSTGSARVYAAVPETGRLVVVDLAAGRCSSVALAPAGTSFGRPVADDGFVLVPDTTAGQAIAVDPSTGRVVAREQVLPAGTDFDLVAKDGVVFYNDVTGPRAGIVRFQGGRWTAGTPVVKFATGSAVPSLAAANDTLASGQQVQGLPPLPAGRQSTSRSTAPGTATSSRSAPTTQARTTTPPSTRPTTTPPPRPTPTTTSATPLICSFTAAPASGEAPLAVTFTDTTSGATSESWSFGDGTTSTGRSVAHTYVTAGTWTAKLTAKDAAGRSCTEPRSIKVTTSTTTTELACSFTVAPGTIVDVGSTLTFTDTTVGATSESWAFGDGTSSAGKTVTHTYAKLGSFTATLTATDGAAGHCVKSQPITVVETAAPPSSAPPPAAPASPGG